VNRRKSYWGWLGAPYAASRINLPNRWYLLGKFLWFYRLTHSQDGGDKASRLQMRAVLSRVGS